ncbi:MAG: DUF4129 domain-containing protein [Chitinispirillaceae bacterium]|nr:DUF4129 domain-containing protein [Chitinispirillaceae bacterium]
MKGAVVLFLLLRCSFAGLLDSLVTPPPLLSLEQAEKTSRRHFRSDKDFCSLPGSILHFRNDSTCFNPARKFAVDYVNYRSVIDDSVVSPDTLPEYNFRVAMSTYRRLGSPRKTNPKKYRFSHATFLKYLEEETEINEMPFLLRQLERFLRFIEKYILTPFFRLILFPFQKLPFFWKIVLFTIAVAGFTAIVFMLGKFTARILPAGDLSAGRNNDGTPATVFTDETTWLRKARDHVENLQPTDAMECLYRYLITWFLSRNKVQRYEWWTNRQFLSILRKRFNGDIPIAEPIISTYERVTYGHYPVEQQHLRELLTLAEQLKGKNRTI